MKNFKKLCGALLITAGIMTPSAQAGYFSWGKDSAVVTGTVAIGLATLACIYVYMNRTQDEVGVDSKVESTTVELPTSPRPRLVSLTKNRPRPARSRKHLIKTNKQATQTGKKTSSTTTNAMLVRAEKRFNKLVEENKGKSDERRRILSISTTTTTTNSTARPSKKISDMTNTLIKQHKQKEQKKKSVRRVSIFNNPAVQNELEKTLNQRNQQQK